MSPFINHLFVIRWFEQDPEKLIESVQTCLNEIAGKIPPDSSLAGLGITNQRETTILWDKTTGRSLCRAIVWNDLRTTDIEERLVQKTPSKSKHDLRVCLCVCHSMFESPDTSAHSPSVDSLLTRISVLSRFVG